MPTNENIQKLIDDNKIVLFMKGTKMFPQCGFSSRSVEIFKRCGVEFKDVNVLADPGIRQGIKDFSNWPTIPQAYVDGKFVGGSDILLEMYENGELQTLLGIDEGADDTDAGPPQLTVTDKAKEAFKSAVEEAGDDVLRFDVSPSFKYDLYFGPKNDEDYGIDVGGMTVFVNKRSARRVNGTKIDFIDGPDGQGFKIDNPNEPPSVKNITAKDLKAAFDAKEELHFFDVRGDKERAIAKIEGDIALDAAGQARLDALDKGAKIVLYCHHGMRSKATGDQLIAQGYTNVFNLTGGIDAWSAQVDDSVPRY
jgi:monothiol glutaredoxin